jgi:hypothetical protein
MALVKIPRSCRVRSEKFFSTSCPSIVGRKRNTGVKLMMVIFTLLRILAKKVDNISLLVRGRGLLKLCASYNEINDFYIENKQFMNENTDVQ